jgi:hypothetical protein
MATTLLELECSEQMAALLDSLVLTGCFGPNRNTAAQRLLEQKVFEMSVDSYGKMSKKEG